MTASELLTACDWVVYITRSPNKFCRVVTVEQPAARNLGRNVLVKDNPRLQVSDVTAIVMFDDETPEQAIARELAAVKRAKVRRAAEDAAAKKGKVA